MPPTGATANPGTGPALQNLDDYDIVQVYGAEYRGIASYYLLASDVWRLDALRWDAETSMLKTLAAKHKSTVTKMAAQPQGQDRDTARAAYLLRGQDRRATASRTW